MDVFSRLGELTTGNLNGIDHLKRKPWCAFGLLTETIPYYKVASVLVVYNRQVYKFWGRIVCASNFLGEFIYFYNKKK